MIFAQRVTGAYAQDGVAGKNSKRLGEDGIGSLRIKYMNEVSQTLYKFNEENDDSFNARLCLVGQGSAALYGTGATQIIGRIGPMLHAQYKYWMQDTGYFLSAYDDHTPFIHFDRYMYGKSNAYTRQSIRLCKYLTLSWMGSVNLSDDAPNKKMLQENAFFFGIGPDDIRLNIGYDTIRQQTFVTMNMHLDAKGSTLEYKKMVVKNPETFGKDKNGDKDTQEFSEPPEKQDVGNTPPLLDEEGNEIPEKAEVINISQARNEP